MYKSRHKFLISLFATAMLCLYTNSYAQDFNWVRSIGGSSAGSGNNLPDDVEDLTTDKFGNIFVVGTVGGNPKVAGSSITPGGYGGNDGYIAKFDKCGNLQWMRIMGNQDDDFGAGVTTDAEGNAYVTGVTFRGKFYSPCKDTLMPTYGNISDLRAFVAKYDVNGCLKWLRTMDGAYANPKRNIKMGTDGKLYCWMACQWGGVDAIFDTVRIGYPATMFFRMDTSGVIEKHKFIDSFPPELIKVEKDKFDNFYLGYLAYENTTRDYSIGGINISIPYNANVTVKLDKDFNMITYKLNHGAGFNAYEVVENRMYSFGQVEKNGVYHGDTTRVIRSKQSPYANKAYISDENLNAIYSSQADTQKISGVKSSDIAIVGGNIYYLLVNGGFLKWGNINMLDFSMFPPSYAVLVKFTKDSLQGSIIDTIPGFVETYQEDFLKVIEADKRGNLYLGGRYAGYLTIGGQTVTPNGGGGSPDAFLMRWGLPCDDTLDALIAPEKPLSLVATASTQTIDINWQDAAQYELGYELYRSIGDTLQWIRIDSLSRNSKDKTDANVQEDIVYWYKVRGFNSGGYSAWSNVDSAVIQKEDSTIIGIESVASIRYMEVYPNPASNNVNVGIYTDYAGNGKLRVLSIEGREYMSKEILLSGGMHREEIATNELSAGVYLIEVQLQNSRMPKRLMIVR